MINLEKVLKEYNLNVFDDFFKEINVATKGDLLDLRINKRSNIFYAYNPFELEKREVTVYIRKEKITKNKNLLNVLLLHELLDAYISYNFLEETDKYDLLKKVKEINKKVLEYIPKEYRGNPKWTLDELDDYAHNIANKVLKKSIALNNEVVKIELPLKKETIEDAIEILTKRGVDPFVATIYCFYRVSSPNI